jgi:hypothetical protein
MEVPAAGAKDEAPRAEDEGPGARVAATVAGVKIATTLARVVLANEMEVLAAILDPGLRCGRRYSRPICGRP